MSPRHENDRYAVQARVEQVGAEGQAKLASSAAAIVGVGALGSTIAQLLVRGGVGRVRLIDPDVAERGNLHRQLLYTEADAHDGRLKAEAAAERLREGNSEVQIEASPVRLTAENVVELLDDGLDVVVDGTDNLVTRYLINDRCVAAQIPWVYGGIAGVHGLVMPVIPGRGPCLGCVFTNGPSVHEESTSQTAGVFGPSPALVGALEAGQAMRILCGALDLPVRLASINLWTGEADAIVVHRAPECATCAGR